MTKCEVNLCTRPATNFQSTESTDPNGKNVHALCDFHMESHGGIKIIGNDVMPENPHQTKQSAQVEPMPSDKHVPAKTSAPVIKKQ